MLLYQMLYLKNDIIWAVNLDDISEDKRYRQVENFFVSHLSN